MNPELLKYFDNVPFPCTLVAYGQERNYRTRFRGENAGWFDTRYCETKDDAVQWIYNCPYEGCLSEMTFFYTTSELIQV